MRKFRIIYYTKEAGGDETACICDTLGEAQMIARKMVGEWMYDHGSNTSVGRVTSAYVADDDGNELSAHKIEGSQAEFDRYIAGDR